MALKITVPIGTDQGITSEAYVRIADYQISRMGYAKFRLQLFQSAEAATQAAMLTPVLAGASVNKQIGEVLDVSLTKQVETETIVKRIVPVEVEVQRLTPNRNEDGTAGPEILRTVTETQMLEREFTETVTVTVPDLTLAEGVDIFAFGYTHLKTKLVNLFGEGNILDC